jgi:hypothetical protein
MKLLKIWALRRGDISQLLLQFGKQEVSRLHPWRVIGSAGYLPICKIQQSACSEVESSKISNGWPYVKLLL